MKPGEPSIKSMSIKRKDYVVDHDIKDVTDVWRAHCHNLGVPKSSPDFENGHFGRVTRFAQHDASDEMDCFPTEPFTREEVNYSIDRLHKRDRRTHYYCW